MVRVEDDAEIPELGAVFTFGKSKFADNVPSKFWIRNDVIKSVACGDEHSVALTGNGRIYVFGSNEWGQLGASNKKMVTKPYCLKALKHEKAIGAAGGRAHTLVTTESGKVYTFGGNSEGQLGLNDNENRSEPCAIAVEANVVAVAAGSYHSVLLTAEGDVYVFGSNSEGQLGLGDVNKVSSPTKLELGIAINTIACGYYHTVLVTRDGKVFTFGEKDSGKLGLLEKQLTEGANSKPQCIFSISERVVSASCGGNHTAVVTECGKLYTFGSGLNGQLGLGTMIMETASPSLVGALDKEKIVSVACGESHTAIVTDQGKLYTCGDGRHGKLALGDENFSNQFNPVLVKKFNGFSVIQVACGGCHMLVLAAKQTSEVNKNDEANSGNEEVMEENTNSVRARRRLKDLEGNLVSTLAPTFGRPLPPLGMNLNENTADTSEEIGNLEQHKDVLNADALNGNSVEKEPTAPASDPESVTKESLTQVLNLMREVTSPNETPVKQPSPAQTLIAEEAPTPVIEVLELAQPPAPVKVEATRLESQVKDDEVRESESSSSENSGSCSEDEDDKKSNQIECKAVIEPEPPPPPRQASSPIPPAQTSEIPETAKNDETDADQKNTQESSPKPVKKKFWTFGRKKSKTNLETGKETAEEVKVVTEKVEVVNGGDEKQTGQTSADIKPSGPTPTDKKPSGPAFSLFGRSVGSTDASKTDETAKKKSTGTPNKSSACTIV